MTRPEFLYVPPLAGGVYYLLNTALDRIYVGSSYWLRERMYQHLSLLQRNRHTNTRMQADWNLYGEHAFELGVLATTFFDYPKSIDIRELETTWIRVYQSDQPAFGYNIAKPTARVPRGY